MYIFQVEEKWLIPEKNTKKAAIKLIIAAFD
jgi:hypothetical protein